MRPGARVWPTGWRRDRIGQQQHGTDRAQAGHNPGKVAADNSERTRGDRVRSEEYDGHRAGDGGDDGSICQRVFGDEDGDKDCRGQQRLDQVDPWTANELCIHPPDQQAMSDGAGPGAIAAGPWRWRVVCRHRSIRHVSGRFMHETSTVATKAHASPDAGFESLSP